MTFFKILIVGRANVGKSTLFNRLSNKSVSIIHDTAGTTRDFKFFDIYLSNFLLRIYDTAGFDFTSSENFLQKEINFINEKLLMDADLLLLVIDSKIGLTNSDKEFSHYLRKFDVNTFLISNKNDNEKKLENYWDSLSLGIDNSFPISAIHGHGINNLKVEIVNFIKTKINKTSLSNEIVLFNNFKGKKNNIDPYVTEVFRKKDSNADFIKLAIVGRPNVGKSTLFNTIIREPRALTSSKSGTTTDPIFVDVKWYGLSVRIVDTAGMRRSVKIKAGVEELSIRKTIEVIKFSEVIIMLLDCKSAFDSQDLKIINHIENEGRCLILVLNKWDIEKNKKEKIIDLRNKIKLSLPQFGDITLVTISALKEQGIKKLRKAISSAKENWDKRFPTSRLNKWLELKMSEHPPPILKGRRIKLRYITQIKSRPPNFLIFSSSTNVPSNYRRFLVNSIRDEFNLKNVPIRLNFKVGKNPYI